MTKVIVRTGEVASFFDRARETARQADCREAFEETVTLTFEDPQQLFTVLSACRRQLMLEILHAPKTIGELSESLHRNRCAIAKDVQLLEKLGLVISERQANAGRKSIFATVAERCG